MVKLFGKLSMKYGVMRSLLGRLGGAVLVDTASTFLRDRRRSPWAFPRGWTNPRRIRSKFVVATKAVSSPSVTNALLEIVSNLRRRALRLRCRLTPHPACGHPLPRGEGRG